MNKKIPPNRKIITAAAAVILLAIIIGINPLIALNKETPATPPAPIGSPYL